MSEAAESSARARLEACLARIADPAGEGERAFTRIYAEEARAMAAASDARAKFGRSLGPLDGAVVSVKDLFDIAGEPTTGGSIVYRDAPPAKRDAPVVSRLRAAGAIIVGKTNMTEFAFSGIGLNPHYGTPGNPADRSRIPGGSSSGAAVAAADGMCEISVGSDTGGSVRIPAAFCGLVGFKPTQSRVPRDGAMALSYTLDSVGPLTRSVARAAATDAILAGEPQRALRPFPGDAIRLAMPLGRLFENLDATVSSRFEAATRVLLGAGVGIDDFDLGPYLQRIDELLALGNVSAIEVREVHGRLLEEREREIDARVIRRIKAGADRPASDYVKLLRRRATLCDEAQASFSRYDALVLPTVPTVAPQIAPLEADQEAFFAANALALRNPSTFNMLDCCSISLPLPGDGLPVGLMLVGARGSDHRLLDIAAGIEAILKAA